MAGENSFIIAIEGQYLILSFRSWEMDLQLKHFPGKRENRSLISRTHLNVQADATHARGSQDKVPSKTSQIKLSAGLRDLASVSELSEFFPSTSDLHNICTQTKNHLTFICICPHIQAYTQNHIYTIHTRTHAHTYTHTHINGKKN